jgi:DNA replication licensing factor MCM7
MDVDTDEDEDDEDDEEDDELALIDIRARVLGRGFTEAQLNQTIIEYEDLDVWMRVASGTKLRFVTTNVS